MLRRVSAGEPGSKHPADEQEEAPERAEARPGPVGASPEAEPPAPTTGLDPSHVASDRSAADKPNGTRSRREAPSAADEGTEPPVAALPPGFVPVPLATSDAPPSPTGPEWDDGEEVYKIYRPSDDDVDTTQ